MRTASLPALGFVAASILLGAVAAACAAPTDALQGPVQSAASDGGSGSTASTGAAGGDPSCIPTGSPPAQIDVSSLPSCCTAGAAHCVPNADLPPGTQVSALATCSGGVCVPDSLVTSGGKAPAACKSLSAAAGVCLSLCVPQVGQYSTLLPQDICQADERCAPCVSPLDGSTTGACDIGKSTGAAAGGSSCTATPAAGDGAGSAAPAPVDAGPAPCPHVGAPVLDPTSLPSCDPNGGAHCLAAALVPAAEASQLAACATGLCVPDSFLESGGQFIPPTCTSLLGAEGRCLDEMIPQVASQRSELPQGTCAAFERCVPCYDPTTGKATGACTLSCDPGPKSPPVKAQTCCSENGADQGECLPTSAVPASEQAQLNKDVCTQTAEATLCVPTEMVAPGFKPTTCTATSLLTLLGGGYSGVCLSKCLNFGFGSGLAISQGDCDKNHECAPCVNPLTQGLTGAPGCPGVDAGL